MPQVRGDSMSGFELLTIVISIMTVVMVSIKQ